MAPISRGSLTAQERETVVLMNDAEGTAEVVTHQSRIYTKLRNNPAAELVEDLSWGTTKGGRFILPCNLVSFRSKSKARVSPSKPISVENHRQV